jgi:hypothetical protein
LQFNEVVKLRWNKAGRDFGAHSEMKGAAQNVCFDITPDLCGNGFSL